MFFSRLSIFLSIVIFLIGIFSFLLGAAAAFGILNEAIRVKYVPRSPDLMVINGALFILAAATLGTLAEISRYIREIAAQPWAPTGWPQRLTDARFHEG